MKRFLLIGIGFLLLGVGYPLFAEGESAKVVQPLVVGTTSGYAPFVSLNDKGQYEGFDIDVANLVAEKLHRPLVIKDCGSMPGLMLALKQGRVDALIWAISITEERLQHMHMIHYQGEKLTEMPFLFWKQVPPGIRKIEDLGSDPKKILCVEAGTSQEDVLKTYPNLKLKYVDKIMDAILEIRYGKSFATTVDPSLISRFTTKHPEIQVVSLPLPSSLHMLGNGICTRKEDGELADRIRTIIEMLKRTGALTELERKWHLDRQEG